jgi:hypothetical protein
MKKAPQRSASAHQRRGSGVFSMAPPLRGADVIGGLPLVSLRGERPVVSGADTRSSRRRDWTRTGAPRVGAKPQTHPLNFWVLRVLRDWS